MTATSVVDPESRAASTSGAAARDGYRSEIDGLRAVSILCVLLYHLDLGLLSGGFVGVDVFFVISGYLITRIILGELREGRFSLGRFWRRRVMRIFPALLAMLLAANAVAILLLTPDEMKKYSEHGVHAALQISNFVFAEKVDYFDVEKAPSPLLHTWSLGVEEQFYLLWPLLLTAVFARWGARGALAAILVAVGVSLALNLAAYIDLNRFAFFHLPTRAWELGAGGVLAAPAIAEFARRRLGADALREAVAVAGLALTIASAALITAGSPFPGWRALGPVLGAALFILATGAGPTRIGAALSWRPIVFIGLISYSLYLWHWPAIVYAKAFYGLNVLTPALQLAIGALSVLLATLSWRFIERPTRTAAPKPIALLGGAAAAIALVIGTALFGGSGADASWRLAHASFERPELRASPFGKDCLHLQPTVPDFDKIARDCTFGPAAPRFDVLLYGDSHALHYLDAARQWAEARGLTLRIVAHGGCPAVLTRARLFSQGVEQKRCAEVATRVRQWVEQGDGVQYVLFAQRFSTYFRSDDRFSSQYVWDEEVQSTAPRRWRPVLERSFAKSFEIVRRAGATPVVLGEAPRLAEHPIDCVERQATMLRQAFPLEDGACGRLHRRYRKRIARRSEVALKRAAEASGAVYFDAAKHMVSGIEDGRFLYYDSNHLSLDGALFLARRMTF